MRAWMSCGQCDGSWEVRGLNFDQVMAPQYSWAIQHAHDDEGVVVRTTRATTGDKPADIPVEGGEGA